MSTSPAEKRETMVFFELAEVFLRRLDNLRYKSAKPTPPILIELLGQFKGGKDTQVNQIERWFDRIKISHNEKESARYQVFAYRESAEHQTIREQYRDEAYPYEMTHFAYSLGNILSAKANRSFHLAIQNRGVVDTLCWLLWNKQQEKISDVHYDAARNFIMTSPWLDYLDGIFFFVCDTETALDREYGTAWRDDPNFKFGSRMNPKSLDIFRACLDAVWDDLKKNRPNLPLFKIDTTHASVERTRDEVIECLLDSVEKRWNLPEEEILPWSVSRMRKQATVHGPEIRLRGHAKQACVMREKWYPVAKIAQKDWFLKRRNGTFLQNDECYHLREQGDTYCLIYKRGTASPYERARIPIPIPAEGAKELLEAHDVVAVIEKEREIFMRDNLQLTRDTVKDLGTFTEIRAMSMVSLEEVMHAAYALGFTDEDIVHDSYVRLYLKKQNQ